MILSGWFLISQRNNNGNSSGKLSFISSMFKSDENDSDNDGLKDWEEVLWKTDKNNSDTDGDGTLDGEEVKQSRDPLKSGPDDQLIKAADVGKTILDNLGYSSRTEDFAKHFFTYFWSFYQSGQLNDETKKQMADLLTEKLSQEKLLEKYKINDLNIINNNNKQSLEIYSNEMQVAIDKYQIKDGENEAVIINSAMSKDNKEELQKLNSIIDLYLGASQAFLSIKVPNGLSSYHLDLVNGVYNLADSLFKIKQTFDDPITGLVGINQYQEAYLKTRQAMNNIGQYLKQ